MAVRSAFSLGLHREECDIIFTAVQRKTLYLPLLERGGKKTIVNVSSGMGSHTLLKDGESGMMAYYISKATVNMLVRIPFSLLQPSLPVESVC